MQRLFAYTSLLALLLCCLVAAAAEPVFPALTGRVVDQASLLSTDQRDYLTSLLKKHEDETSNQMVVVTLKSLQGYSIEEFGYQLGRHWGIGQKQRNNGVLLIVAPNERKVRIEVGYGLEGVLTDYLANDIIQNKILPHFRDKQYPHGIEAGTMAIIQTLQGSYTPLAKTDSSEFNKILAASIFIFLAILFIGNVLKELIKNAWLSSAILSMAAFAAVWLISGSVSLALAFAVAMFLFFLMFNEISNIWPDVYNDPHRRKSWYDNDSSGFGSFGGGGGFSGGGGSFGGGGSSGSW